MPADGEFGAPVPCPGPTPFCEDSECHACTQDAHCQPASGECKDSFCAGNNTCAEQDKPDNTLLTDPTPGDCNALACFGGQPEAQPDPSDVATDLDPNDCTIPGATAASPKP